MKKKSYLVRAVSMSLATVIAAASFLTTFVLPAKAASLSYIETIKANKEASNSSFNVVELAPTTTSGLIGYYMAGQEAVAKWNSEAATLANDKSDASNSFTPRSTYASGVLGNLATAGIMSTNNAAAPLSSSGNYTEYYPWAANIPGTAQTMTLDNYDKASAKGIFTEQQGGDYNLDIDYVLPESEEANLFNFNKFDLNALSGVSDNITRMTTLKNTINDTITCTQTKSGDNYTKHGASNAYYNVPVEPNKTYKFSFDVTAPDNNPLTPLIIVNGGNPIAQFHLFSLNDSFVYTFPTPSHFWYVSDQNILVQRGQTVHKEYTFTVPSDSSYAQLRVGIEGGADFSQVIFSNISLVEQPGYIQDIEYFTEDDPEAYEGDNLFYPAAWYNKFINKGNGFSNPSTSVTLSNSDLVFTTPNEQDADYDSFSYSYVKSEINPTDYAGYYSIAVTPGEQYTFSAKVKATGDAKGQYRIFGLDKNFNPVTVNEFSRKTDLPTGNIRFEFTCPDNVYYLQFTLGTCSGDGEVIFSDLSFTKTETEVSYYYGIVEQLIEPRMSAEYYAQFEGKAIYSKNNLGQYIYRGIYENDGSGALIYDNEENYTLIADPDKKPVTAKDAEHPFLAVAVGFVPVENGQSGYFVRRDGEGYYVGGGNGFYNFTPDTRGSDYVINTKQIKYTGGYVNNEWFKYKVLNCESETFGYTVTTYSPKLSAGLAAYAAGADLIVLTKGLDMFGTTPTVPSFNADITKEAKDNVLQAVNSGTAIMVDIELADLDENNFPNLAALVETLLEDRSIAGTAVEIEDGGSCDNIFAFNKADFTVSYLANQKFYTAKVADSKYTTEGKPYYYVHKEIFDENQIRSALGQDELSGELAYISQANCLRSIINYKGKRGAVNLDKIRILDIEPYASSDSTCVDADGHTVEYGKTGDNIENTSNVGNVTTHVLSVEDALKFMPEGTDADKIEITTMSASAFVGDNSSVVENYDVVYIGASLGNMYTRRVAANGDGAEYQSNGDAINQNHIIPDYNDPNMDGMYYTNTGDSIKTAVGGEEEDEDDNWFEEAIYAIKHAHLLKRPVLTGLLHEDYAELVFNQWMAKAGTTTVRGSGNDINEKKYQELVDFANSGKPVIFADSLTREAVSKEFDLFMADSDISLTPNGSVTTVNLTARIREVSKDINGNPTYSTSNVLPTGVSVTYVWEFSELRDDGTYAPYVSASSKFPTNTTATQTVQSSSQTFSFEIKTGSLKGTTIVQLDGVNTPRMIYDMEGIGKYRCTASFTYNDNELTLTSNEANINLKEATNFFLLLYNNSYKNGPGGKFWFEFFKSVPGAHDGPNFQDEYTGYTPAARPWITNENKQRIRTYENSNLTEDWIDEEHTVKIKFGTWQYRYWLFGYKWKDSGNDKGNYEQDHVKVTPTFYDLQGNKITMEVQTHIWGSNTTQLWGYDKDYHDKEDHDYDKNDRVYYDYRDANHYIPYSIQSGVTGSGSAAVPGRAISSSSLEPNRFDSCSYMWRFASEVYNKFNVFANSDVCADRVRVSNLINNLSTPKITEVSGNFYSVPSFEINDHKKSSSKTISVGIKFKEGTTVSGVDYSYKAKLYIDADKDGKFSAGELQNDASSIVSISPGATGATVSRTLPSSFMGVVPWKVVVQNDTVSYAHDSVTGFSYITPTGNQKTEINALMILPGSWSHEYVRKTDADRYADNEYLGNIFESDIFDQLCSSNIDNVSLVRKAGYTGDDGFYHMGFLVNDDIDLDIACWNIYQMNKYYDDSSNPDILPSYNMLILGFGDTYGKMELDRQLLFNAVSLNEGFTLYSTLAINEYIESGKPVLFCHDTTNVSTNFINYIINDIGSKAVEIFEKVYNWIKKGINAITSLFNTFFGTHIKQIDVHELDVSVQKSRVKQGYYNNLFLRDSLGLDRYGITKSIRHKGEKALTDAGYNLGAAGLTRRFAYNLVGNDNNEGVYLRGGHKDNIIWSDDPSVSYGYTMAEMEASNHDISWIPGSAPYQYAALDVNGNIINKYVFDCYTSISESVASNDANLGDTNWTPSENTHRCVIKNTSGYNTAIHDPEVKGWKYITKMTTNPENGKTYVAGKYDKYTQGYTSYTINRYMDYNVFDSTSSRQHKIFSTFTDRSKEITRTTRITQVNEGQLTSYPYDINIKASTGKNYWTTYTTHEQAYTLNMVGDDITCWYCMTSDGSNESKAYGYMENDCYNSYYIFSRGNVTYTGAGHTNRFTLEEAKLFINTLVAAYRVNMDSPVADWRDEGNTVNKRYQMVVETGELQNAVNTLTGSKRHEFDPKSKKVYFRVTDKNIEGKTVSASFSYLNESTNQRVAFTPTLDSGSLNNLTTSQLYSFSVPQSVLDVLEADSDGTIRIYVQATTTKTTGDHETKTSDIAQIELRRFVLSNLS
ncbi:MAG: DUF5057 domain-containing protein [Clostridia bacterium]|nr:DUF5057 domain-containing protein [Clostridia bacterium]